MRVNEFSKDSILKRYERNIHALSVEDMHKLHVAKVCIVGCGGLGGYIAEILARIGVLHITIVDYDVFDESNLNRQLFSTEKVIGERKIDIAIDRIAAVNSQVKVHGVGEKLDEKNAAGIFAGHDVVVDALDNLTSRMVLIDTCEMLKIPVVHGSIAGWTGQVACLMPGSGAAKKLFGNIGGKRTNPDRGIEKDLGNLPFTASVVASIECAECVKIIVDKNAIVDALIQIDLFNGGYRLIPFA